MRLRFRFLPGGLLLAGILLIQRPVPAQDETAKADEVLAGHSYHGEAFNEGPRQQAYLMPGLGRSQFKVSANNTEAQGFFNQGVDQLHGFWYFEAERSFRQVAILDPDCAMAYWGLAMANINNEDRARKFIQQADEKSKSDARETTDHEKLYIDALSALYDKEVKDKKKRHENFTDKLEAIVLKHPDDIEAKAFLACQIWMNQRSQLPITSHVAVNSLLDQVFEVNPMHPSHHYRIHLWDYKNAEIALASSAKCGPSLPDIAHMWHMPGHIYSKLKRYEDAVWQQEASARVDHRHMMHDRVLPDQIHNFAHNNEWCVRNLNNVGRVRDAIDLATNMISMPRHPKYNHLDNRGSTWYGRQRLFETLSRYELWQELVDTCQTVVLEPTDKPLQQIHRLRYLGRAHFRLDNKEEAAKVLQDLQDRLANAKQSQQEKRADKIEDAREKTESYQESSKRMIARVPRSLREDFAEKLNKSLRRDHRKRMAEARSYTRKKIENEINVIKRAIDEMEGYQCLASEEFEEAKGKLGKAGEVDAIFRATLLHRAGKTEQAIKDARKFVESHENEVQPLANLAWLLWQAEQKDEAKAEFEKLRELSAAIDMQSPVFQRLQPIAKHCGVDGDWRSAAELADDLGHRPDLTSLGPFRWQPVDAPEFELVDSSEQTVSLKQFQGQPVLVIFYLGHGCLHCAEQLQKFAPMQDEFLEAGIEMVAISTDGREGLKESIDAYGDVPLPIQLLANQEFDVFKEYRAFDEFENQPLHGTYLIDGDGKIRWQDISYEPFMDAEFLLKESVRLLDQEVE